MQSPAPALALLTPIAYRNTSCGYCKNKSGSFVYYASSRSLTPAFYQSLLDRGWRRSGTTLYKPDQRASCCPHYTLRLDSSQCHPSKDQRQAVNRFTKYILGEQYMKEAARLYPKSREASRRRDTHFDLVERNHECEEAYVEMPPDPAHSFVVTLESNEFSEEKYALYENYERLVHKQPPPKITRPGFERFLCSSPLSPSTTIIDGQERWLGSYHQCYRIDGVLVAIGVIDLLPHSVSGVYFIYHECVHRYSFGKLGALREIAMALEDGYKWWYSGFYIHNCKKMKYKGDFTPQYILDPESYSWDLFDDEVRRKLDENKYLSLARERRGSQSPFQNLSIPAGSDVPQDGDESGEDEAETLDPEVPIWDRFMPGILSRQEILAQVNLDRIRLRISDQDVETGDLMNWEEWDMDHPDSIKGAIAELVAAVGADLAKEMTVTFSS